MTDGKQSKERKNCIGREHPCSLCNEEKDKSQFTFHMWKERLRTKRVICLDCCRPRCTAKLCKTCSVCRDPSCVKRKCSNPITPLHPNKRLHNKADLDTYLCERCRWITCACGNIMPQRTQRRYKNTAIKEQIYICSHCRARNGLKMRITRRREQEEERKQKKEESSKKHKKRKKTEDDEGGKCSCLL